MILEIIIFNVGAGQTVLVYPLDHPDHAMLIDCGGNENSEEVINYLVKKLPKYLGKSYLGCLAISHFDHDHYSFLPELIQKVHIANVLFPKNISPETLLSLKSEKTAALDAMYNLILSYTAPSINFNPRYYLYSVHLESQDLNNTFNTNQLGQLIFISFEGSTICITGDLEKPAWDILLKRTGVQFYLKKTNVFIAAHHGRLNGYHPDIFLHCQPETIIISDQEVIYGTQIGMSQKYESHIKGNGILLGGINRKIITTRNDGHLEIHFNVNGTRNYSQLGAFYGTNYQTSFNL